MDVGETSFIGKRLLVAGTRSLGLTFSIIFTSLSDMRITQRSTVAMVCKDNKPLNRIMERETFYKSLYISFA